MNLGLPMLKVERAAVSMYTPYADWPENAMKKGMDTYSESVPGVWGFTSLFQRVIAVLCLSRKPVRWPKP